MVNSDKLKKFLLEKIEECEVIILKRKRKTKCRSRIDRCGMRHLLVLRNQRRRRDLRDHQPRIEAGIAREEGRQPELIAGSTSSAIRRSAMAPISAERDGDLVGREGDRLGVEVAARDDGAVLQHQGIVGDRIGLDVERARGDRAACRGRRPSPAVGSGAIGVLHAVVALDGGCRGLRCRRAARAARRRRSCCPAWPRSVWIRLEGGVRILAAHRRDIAPVTSAARNTRSAANSPASASAVETCVPLISPSPSFGPSVTGANPAARSASPAGAPPSTVAFPDHRRCHVRERREVARGADRALGGIRGSTPCARIASISATTSHRTPEAPRPRLAAFIARISRTMPAGSGAPTPQHGTG